MSQTRGCPLSIGSPYRCPVCDGSLPSLRSSFCSTACELSWRINHLWDSARDAALLRTGGTCEVCSSPDGVEVHHDPPVGRRGYGQGCQHHQANLRPLCHAHHREAHRALRALPRPTQLALIAA